MKTALLILCLLFCLSANSQTYYFGHYSADDGLSHNTVTALLEDHNGMIWIGTKSGLNSFNGYHFKTYQNKSNNLGAIGNNHINSLCEDHQGNIWIGTGRGITRLDPIRETYFEIPVTDGIGNILVDSDNNIWFFKSSVLCRYNQQQHRLTYFQNIVGISMQFGHHGQIWIGNQQGQLFSFNPNTRIRSTPIQLINRKLPQSHRQISKLLVTPDEILIGTIKHGLLSYRPDTREVKSLLSKTDDNADIYVRDIIAAQDKNYWVATESGIYIYNLSRGSFTHLKRKPEDPYALSDNAIYCLLKDHDNGYWAGTYFSGINYLSPVNNQFKKYINIKGTNSISGNAVREMSSFDGQNLWIGTEDAGVNKFNIKSGLFTQYTSNRSHKSISYPNIHGLLATRDSLYIGPFLHGLNIMNIKTGQIIKDVPIINEKDKRPSDFVMSIFQTSDHKILIGTITGGLHQYLPQQNAFKRMEFMPQNSNVYAIAEDHTGTIWTGSLRNGTFYYNPKTGIKGNIKFTRGQDYEHQIQGIYEDQQHYLWLSTEGGGLISLDPSRNVIKTLTTKNGLPSNYIYRTIEDQLGNLWISTLKGLVCLNLRSHQLKVFTRANGLITDQFNYNSAYKDLKGNLYFGTVQGMIVFNPAEVLRKTAAPKVHLTAFQINNSDVSPGSSQSPLHKAIGYTDTIRLAYQQSSFNIEFAAFNYSAPKTISYQYTMKGLGNNTWTNVKSTPKAWFTDLSPGTYTFKVKATDSVGGWVSPETRLIIKIAPPFWRSFTAYVVYVLLILFIIYQLAYYYKKSLDVKNQRKLQLFQFEKDKEIYQAKIEFFTHIAHEIQTPLTLIQGPVERIMNKIDEVPAIRRSMQMINKNTNRLLSLTSQLLDFRKTEIDQFGLSFVKLNIAQVLKQEVKVFKSQMERRKLQFELKVPENGLIAFVDYEAFNKIVSNLLSNAIKYAQSAITVELLETTEADPLFTIRFINDGDAITGEQKEKVFEPFYRMRRHIEKPGTGIGLPIARSLAELHNGTLKLADSSAGIIIFELRLPIHQSVEFNLNKWKKI